MPRRIVPVFAVLLAVLAGGVAVAPGRFGPAAARQASPGAGTPCPTTSPEENEALVRRYREEVWGRGNFAVLDEVIANLAITSEQLVGNIGGRCWVRVAKPGSPRHAAP